MPDDPTPTSAPTHAICGQRHRPGTDCPPASGEPLSPAALLSLLSMTAEAFVEAWPATSEVREVTWTANKTAQLVLELLNGHQRGAVELADDIAEAADQYRRVQEMLAAGEIERCEECGDVYDAGEQMADHVARMHT